LPWGDGQCTEFAKPLPESVDESIDFIRDNFPSAFANLRDRVNASHQRSTTDSLQQTSHSQRVALSLVANLSTPKQVRAVKNSAR
jgi:hypothetical protein